MAKEEKSPAAFTVTLPSGLGPSSVLVFGSPHSGRDYPATLMEATRLDALEIRASEDAFVDRLIETAPLHGIATIAARFGRAYIDVNREPWELDPRMFEGELPSYARCRSARVAAGLGVIAKIVREGRDIYARKLTFADAAERVSRVHAPYHRALAELVETARAARGMAILIDWHSMPKEATRAGCGSATPDIVLGDRFGAACSPAVARHVEKALTDLGFRVARNTPYAGGYTTEHYGKPRDGVHALQIEISRGLYLNEVTLEPNAGYADLTRRLDTLFGDLAAVDWAAI